MENNTHFLSYRVQFFLEWGMLQAKVIEKIKTYILNSSYFENGAVCKIVWKNIVEPSGP